MTRPRQDTISTYDARIALVRYATGADEQTAADLVQRLTADVISAVSTDIRNRRWPADSTPTDIAEWLSDIANEIRTDDES